MNDYESVLLNLLLLYNIWKFSLYFKAIHNFLEKYIKSEWFPISFKLSFILIFLWNMYALYYGMILWRPENVSLFPHWPKVRESEHSSSSFKVILLPPQTKVPPRGCQRVLVSQGSHQQVWVMAWPCTLGIEK